MHITHPSNICSECNGEFVLREENQLIMPKNGTPYRYMLEFSMCNKCSRTVVKSTSIIKNDHRRRQAQKEAAVTYKMKQWLENIHT